jgi:hypothetical protein
MIDPCINPKTQKPFDWENPEFTPGKYCTSCRFNELPNPKYIDFAYTCENCIERVRAWKKRSNSAKKAALKRKHG